MTAFQPKLTITNAITRDLTKIERAPTFLDAATLSGEWIARMSQQAFLLEAHHTTHIEQLEALCPGTTRRSLQRDLKTLVDKEILQSHGEARATRYSLLSLD
jgi:hypothetical protein